MKTFKHKTLDYTAKQSGNKYFVSKKGEGSYLDKELVENSCDWEDVVEEEKDYEILSFKSNRTGQILSIEDEYFSCEDIVKNSFWDIHSIKRLSDNVIFKVGDVVVR